MPEEYADHTGLIVAGGVAAVAIAAGLAYVAYAQGTPGPLKAVLLADPTDGPAPLNVTFEVSQGTAVQPFTQAWDFGDGTQATTENGVPVTHLYQTAGTYDVAMVLTDARNESVTANVTITVNNPVGGLTPVLLTGTANPDFATTTSIINLRGSLVTIPAGAYVVGAEIAVSVDGVPTTTVTTDSAGEFGADPVVTSGPLTTSGNHTVLFAFSQTSQYEATATEAFVNVS